METNESNSNNSRALTCLYRNLLSYVVVMLFLFTINYIRFNGYWWVIWPALGWGVNILLQAIHTVLFKKVN